jgi:hypothetical protein
MADGWLSWVRIARQRLMGGYPGSGQAADGRRGVGKGQDKLPTAGGDISRTTDELPPTGGGIITAAVAIIAAVAELVEAAGTIRGRPTSCRWPAAARRHCPLPPPGKARRALTARRGSPARRLLPGEIYTTNQELCLALVAPGGAPGSFRALPPASDGWRRVGVLPGCPALPPRVPPRGTFMTNRSFPSRGGKMRGTPWRRGRDAGGRPLSR